MFVCFIDATHKQLCDAKLFGTVWDGVNIKKGIENQLQFPKHQKLNIFKVVSSNPSGTMVKMWSTSEITQQLVIDVHTR